MGRRWRCAISACRWSSRCRSRRSPPPLGAALFGFFIVRLSGIYLAMLTLAAAQILYAVAFQWVEVTGGDNGLVGIWPSRWAASRLVYYYLTLAFAAAAVAALRHVIYAPFGYTLRAARDSELRADAIGIDVRRHRWLAFILAGAVAGLAGGLYVFLKGSIDPSALGIPVSVDALDHAAPRRPADRDGPARRRRRAARAARPDHAAHRAVADDRSACQHHRHGAAVPAAASSAPSTTRARAASCSRAAASPSRTERLPRSARTSGACCKSLLAASSRRATSASTCPSLERGELLALIGPNGAGKTTTFNMVGGQLRPDAGAIVLDGEDVTRLTPREKFRRGVGRTFQIAQTFLSMTVAENVQMALISHAGETRAVRPNARRLHRDEAMSCSRRSAWTPSPTGRARRLPMATSSASSSRSRSRAGRSFSSWTSRPPAWRRASAPR